MQPFPWPPNMYIIDILQMWKQVFNDKVKEITKFTQINLCIHLPFRCILHSFTTINLLTRLSGKQRVKEVLLLRLRRLIHTRVVVIDVHNFGLVCHLATGLYSYSLLPSTTIRKTIWRKVVSLALENFEPSKWHPREGKRRMDTRESHWEMAA